MISRESRSLVAYDGRVSQPAAPEKQERWSQKTIFLFVSEFGEYLKYIDDVLLYWAVVGDAAVVGWQAVECSEASKRVRMPKMPVPILLV